MQALFRPLAFSLQPMSWSSELHFNIILSKRKKRKGEEEKEKKEEKEEIEKDE